MSAEAAVTGSWRKLYEGVNLSSQSFYRAVEDGLSRRQVPGASASRVTHQEGGIASDAREYLRIERSGTRLDICAAPFGTGFFFSWWMTRKAPRWGPLYVIFVLVASWILWRGTLGILDLPIFTSMLASLVILPAALWGVCLLGKMTLPEFEDALLTLPLVGGVYQAAFQPLTYYRLDTASMFQAAVHSAVLEAIDELVEEKGLERLSEHERRPVFTGLLGRH